MRWGGDAQLTAYFAKKYPNANFSIIDFSPLGCELARSRARLENVNISIQQADMFSPPKALIGYFDLVISLGVVEHFTDLASVMMAKKALIGDSGKLFTLIPNMASPIYANLCKRWSKTVYDDHVPHTMQSFLDGHKDAGLKIVDYGYLGSVEFSMLSMAMSGPEPKSRFDKSLYLWLTRIGKAIHFIEYRLIDFPTSQLFSPFMYAVSAKNNCDEPHN